MRLVWCRTRYPQNPQGVIMPDGKWAQYKNDPNREKWKVIAEDDDEYIVQSKKLTFDEHYLPKSEYIPCDPPEQWEECTREVVRISDNNHFLITKDTYISRTMGDLLEDQRWAWKGDALVIERKVSK